MGRTILTAAHVVAKADRVWVRFADRNEYHATVTRVGDDAGWRADGHVGPDLAVLAIGDPIDNAPPFEGVGPLLLGQLDRTAPGGQVGRARTLGYPRFAQVADSATAKLYRETVEAAGQIMVGSHLMRGLLDLQVSITPRDLPGVGTPLQSSPWQGMSGAPVFVSGYLVGIVNEHAPRSGPSSLTVTPLAVLDEYSEGVSAAWWRLLAVDGLGDLTVLPRRREATYQATLREYGQSLHARMPRLAGRDSELQRIAGFATGSGTALWIIGGAYAGKSALVYEAVTSGILPDDVDVVTYFFNRRRSDASAGNFLAAVVGQLEVLCDWDHETPTMHRFDQAWQEAVERADRTRRHLLLLVDALDEDVEVGGANSVLRLLPSMSSKRTHLLVTSRANPEFGRDLDRMHPLAGAERWQLTPFEGSAERAAAAKQEIDDLARSADADIEILGLLTAARGPLSTSDLAVLLAGPGVPGARERRAISRLIEGAARSLERVGNAGQPRYQYAHALLADHASANQLLADIEYQWRLDAWADTWAGSGWPEPAPDGQGTPLYLLDTYPAALLARGDFDRLAVLASDSRWLVAVICALGVDQVWPALQAAQARPGSPATTLLAIIAAQASNLRKSETIGWSGCVEGQLRLQSLVYGEVEIADSFQSPEVRTASLIPRVTTDRRARPSQELGRPFGGVQSAAALPDGRVVTSGGGRVLLWSPDAPGKPREMDGPSTGKAGEAVRSGARTSDGEPVLVLWDPDPDNNLARSRSPRPLLVITALQDGRVIIGGDGGLTVWTPDTGNLKELGRAGDWITAGATLPDNRVVTCSRDGVVSVWDPDNGDGPDTLGRDAGWLTAVAALADGTVLTGNRDGDVLMWRTDGVHPPRRIGRAAGEVEAVAPLPDGRAVTGNRDGGLLIWDLRSPGFPQTLGIAGGLEAMVALSDGRVVTADRDGEVLVWDATAPGPPRALAHGIGQVEALSVLPNGRVVTGSWGGGVLVWDPDPPDPRTSGEEEPVPGVGGNGSGGGLPRARKDATEPDSSVVAGWRTQRSRRAAAQAAVLLPDGFAVTLELDRTVLLWDPAQPGATRTIDFGIGAITAMPDGRLATSSSYGVRLWTASQLGEPEELGSEAGALHRWNPRSGSVGRGLVRAVAALPDGRVVTGSDAVGSGPALELWDPSRPDGPHELYLGAGSVTTLAGLGDGRIVVGWTSAAPDAPAVLLLWDPTDRGRPRELFRAASRFTAAAAMPDGRIMVIAAGRVWLIDVAEAGSPHPMDHDGIWIADAVVLSSGRIATCDRDSRIRIWNPDETIHAEAVAFETNCLAANLETLVSAGPEVTWWNLPQ